MEYQDYTRTLGILCIYQGYQKDSSSKPSQNPERKFEELSQQQKQKCSEQDKPKIFTLQNQLISQKIREYHKKLQESGALNRDEIRRSRNNSESNKQPLVSEDTRIQSGYITINTYEDLQRPNVFINPESAKRLQPIINHSLLNLQNFRGLSNDKVESKRSIPISSFSIQEFQKPILQKKQDPLGKGIEDNSFVLRVNQMLNTRNRNNGQVLATQNQRKNTPQRPQTAYVGQQQKKETPYVARTISRHQIAPTQQKHMNRAVRELLQIKQMMIVPSNCIAFNNTNRNQSAKIKRDLSGNDQSPIENPKNQILKRIVKQKISRGINQVEYQDVYDDIQVNLSKSYHTLSDISSRRNLKDKEDTQVEKNYKTLQISNPNNIKIVSDDNSPLLRVRNENLIKKNFLIQSYSRKETRNVNFYHPLSKSKNYQDKSKNNDLEGL
ncbi:UNKNOWN [Stylonychia lemnae]|uniref:Uncharacterized protein n=1 Tax=Stylonychia lemnae TaxID=5949 RepID=A0A077ZWQ6_STYLE|nr:UNKNOWN [Stylonychia lemnae]|eukprot:CDW74284.1 UNKNOWN [Stylonychia lemnae]